MASWVFQGTFNDIAGMRRAMMGDDDHSQNGDQDGMFVKHSG